LIDNMIMSKAMARFFVSGKSELFPFDQATIDSYQGNLVQNPKY
jgi:starch-binding outer membrane protein, SusD/RagB family